MKKSVAILLVLALVLSISSFSFAESQSINSVDASTMRLMRTDGSVFLKDSSGSLPAREGMRLASGNVLSTEAKSRAGILLDDYKAVTLNELSRASLMAEGKALELNLEHGAMFFSVSQPLDADESYSIRTSTMILGIRGTSGYVETLSATESAVTLTSGHAVVSILAGGELPLGPGQRITIHTDASGTQFSSLNVTPYDFPGLLLSGLISDPQILNEADAQNGNGFKEAVLDAALYHALRQGDFSLFAGQYTASTPGFAELTLNPNGSTDGGTKNNSIVWNGSAPVSVTRTDEGAYHCVVLGTGTETPESYNPAITFEYYNLYPFNATINYVSSQSGSVEDAWFTATGDTNNYETYITASYTSSAVEGSTPSSSVTSSSSASLPTEESTPSTSAVPSYTSSVAEEIVYSPSVTGAYPELSSYAETSEGTTGTTGSTSGTTGSTGGTSGTTGGTYGTTGGTSGTTGSTGTTGTTGSTSGTTGGTSGTSGSNGDYTEQLAELEDLINSINDGSYFDGLFNGSTDNNQSPNTNPGNNNSTGNDGNNNTGSNGNNYSTSNDVGRNDVGSNGSNDTSGKVISNDAGNSGGSNDTGNAVSYDPTGAPVQSASSNGTPGTVPSSDAGAASSSDNNNQNGNNTYDPVADYSAAVDNYVNSILGNLFG